MGILVCGVAARGRGVGVWVGVWVSGCVGVGVWVSKLMFFFHSVNE